MSVAEITAKLKREVKASTATAVELADRISPRIASELSAGNPKLYISYAGFSYSKAAAVSLYRTLTQLAQVDVVLEDATTLIYHVLAYRENPSSIILFVEPGNENTLGRLADTAKYTGGTLVALTPPLPPILKQRVEQSAEVVEVAAEKPVVTYLSTALLVAAKLADASGGVKLRINRVLSEVSSLDEAVEELVERYKQQIGEMARLAVGNNDSVVIFTPTMEPAAIVYVSAAFSRGGTTRMLSVSEALAAISLAEKLKWSSVLILSTDAEQDSVREIQFKLSMKNPNTRKILVNVRTDPLTAPLYATILVEASQMLEGVNTS